MAAPTMPDHARIVATYSAAADHFDALPFWHEFGRRTVERIALAPGERVLDLCCGTGASTLPAARAVGPTGSVLGVDLTPALVERARALAADAGLTHAQFVVGDVDTLTYPSGSFDAVLSVFGIFFVDDMAGLLRRACSWLAPGGRLAVTVWGEVVLAPGEPLFWEAVRREDPSLEHISPAGRVTTPQALRALFADAGIAAPEVTVERWRMPLAGPEAFWPVIMGTSNRGVWDALSPAAQGRVRRYVEEALARDGVGGLTSEAIVAVATRGRRRPA
jgi:SAM-dependent methyltransferase